jgi:SpoVK/Ycf46/Vps4 family AAA+-type ATPase
LNDTEPAGAIAEGVPGTGKSLSALAAATLFGCPVVRVNPGKMKGGIVGESEKNAARVFALLRSFGGLQFWVATSNRLDTVPEELSDRFPGGVYFFDLPSADELPLIWRANLLRYGFDPSERWTDDSGWTGRDVRAVCLEARRTRQSIAAVAAQRIPGSRRMARRIDRMRESARSEAYKSATTGLAYAGPVVVAPTSGPAKQRVRALPKPTPSDETF